MGETGINHRTVVSKSTQANPALYFLLVLLLTLPFWALGSLAARPSAVQVNLPLSALGAICPVTAAAILTYREGGWLAVRKLLHRAWDANRISKKVWLLVALLTMPLVLALSYVVMRLGGLPLPAQIQVPLLMAPVFFIVYTIAAACEELGWTGYATDPLQARWGALPAALMIGAFWAGWHVLPYFQAHNSPGWVLWQCVFTVASRVLMIWIYNNAGRSVMTAILYHAMYNVSWSLFPNYGSHYDPLLVGLITCAVAIGVTVIWGPKTFTRKS